MFSASFWLLTLLLILVLMAAAQITGLFMLARLGRSAGWYLTLFGSIGFWFPVISYFIFSSISVSEAIPGNEESWHFVLIGFLIAIVSFSAGFLLLCLQFRKIRRCTDEFEKRVAATAAEISLRSR